MPDQQELRVALLQQLFNDDEELRKAVVSWMGRQSTDQLPLMEVISLLAQCNDQSAATESVIEAVSAFLERAGNTKLAEIKDRLFELTSPYQQVAARKVGLRLASQLGRSELKDYGEMLCALMITDKDEGVRAAAKSAVLKLRPSMIIDFMLRGINRSGRDNDDEKAILRRAASALCEFEPAVVVYGRALQKDRDTSEGAAREDEEDEEGGSDPAENAGERLQMLLQLLVDPDDEVRGSIKQVWERVVAAPKLLEPSNSELQKRIAMALMSAHHRNDDVKVRAAARSVVEDLGSDTLTFLLELEGDGLLEQMCVPYHPVACRAPPSCLLSRLRTAAARSLARDATGVASTRMYARQCRRCCLGRWTRACSARTRANWSSSCRTRSRTCATRRLRG